MIRRPSLIGLRLNLIGLRLSLIGQRLSLIGLGRGLGGAHEDGLGAAVCGVPVRTWTLATWRKYKEVCVYHKGS
jgi:hypothetical protein